MTTELVLRVEGMTCGGCENSVQTALGEIAGIDQVEADHAQDRVTVAFDPQRVQDGIIRSRIEELGFHVAG